ncbi:hypothetical protein HC766_00335 [Candidatus Gracilibacteria bacterium]|nr:hypothetical protein [Candidatus Gracilibacteria bacterium]
MANYKKDLGWGREYVIEYVEEFELIKSVVEKLRSLRGLFAIDPATRITVYSGSQLLQKYSQYLGFIAKCDVKKFNDGKLYEVKINQANSFGIDILSYVMDRVEEINKTNKEIASLEKQIGGLEKKLSNLKFIEHASVETVEESKENLSQRKIELENQREKLEVLNDKNED